MIYFSECLLQLYTETLSCRMINRYKERRRRDANNEKQELDVIEIKQQQKCV